MSRVWDIPVQESTRVRDARVAAEAACAEVSLDAPSTAAAALVATELATNLVKHARGGRIVINLVSPADSRAGTEPCVQIVSLDHGPGIGDVGAASTDGYTTSAASLGAGLGTCRRVADDFDLHSRPGEGTVAVARITSTRRSRAAGSGRAGSGLRTGGSVRAGRNLRVGGSVRVGGGVRAVGNVGAGENVRAGGVTASYAHAEHSGDAFAWVRSGPRVTLLLADGLGHGEKAAQASTAAVEELRSGADLPPADLLRRLHTVLRTTRGAAVGVAQLDEDTGRLSFGGVGNIGARLRTGTGWQPFISHPGIVGAHFPANVPLREADWGHDSLLVLHSDGLPGRWVPPRDPLLLAHDPAVVAAVVLRDAGSAARPLRDDTSVAVLTPAADGGP
ncbi:SpoIIE family protein phosphatase [Streptomyces griseorubiginosus]|uniref:SpoIIE family protein phosphatase n=1 Tax=Streptomyces griseorubiginosus TaxID=67304 RepID=UPI0033D08C3F